MATDNNNPGEHHGLNDEQFTKSFIAMNVGLIVITFLLALLGIYMANDVMTRIDAEAAVERDKLVAARVAPEGALQVGAVAEAPAAAATEMSGAEVYGSACAACHAAGIAGAPKFGDAGVWGDRIAQGMELLVEHAINGYQGKDGYMPPKGGNAALTDDQVKAAVEHMVDATK